MSSFFLRVITRLGERFDRRYSLSIVVGLATCLWFSVFANAAHDLWAACFVFGFLTLLVLVLFAGHYRTRQSIQLPLFVPVLLALAAFVVASNSSYDFMSSRFECWVWFFSFIGFYLLLNSARKPAELNFFFVLSSYVLVPLALLCIYLRVRNQTPEIHGTLINSVILSGFALYWVFFLWEGAGQGGFRTISFVAVLIILVLGRSWWVAISLAIGLMYYYEEVIKTANFKRRSALIFYSLLSLLACGAIFFFKLSLYHKYGYPDSNRLAWWLAAAKMTIQHPLTGVGLGAYGTAYPYFHVGRGLNSLYVHNFLLQLLSETGLLGMATFLWLALVIARRIQLFKTPTDRSSSTRRVFIATLITVCIYSLVQINMDYFLNKLMFLFVLAPLIKPDKADWTIQPSRWMVLGVLCMVLLIPSWIVPWIASTRFVEGTRHEENHDWSAARDSYLKATELDRSYGDAYAGLARTYGQAYRESGSAADLAEWRADLMEAFRWKKSAHFLAELEHPPQ